MRRVVVVGMARDSSELFRQLNRESLPGSEEFKTLKELVVGCGHGLLKYVEVLMKDGCCEAGVCLITDGWLGRLHA